MRMRSSVRSVLTAVIALAIGGSLAPPLSAQTVLLQEDGLVPTTDWTISSLGNTSARGDEGIGIGGNATTSEGLTLSFFAGSVPGGGLDRGFTLDLLRFEETIGDFEQVSFESFWGLNEAGEIAYSPSCNNLVTGSTGLDGVWLDDLPVGVEEEVYQNDNSLFWSFGSRPTVTASGQIAWVGGITSTLGGSTESRGLFLGTDATPLVIGGGMIGGLPDPVSTGSTGISFDYRVSALASHWIAEVGTETGSTSNDNSMVMDGSVIELGGSPMSEGTTIPASIGGMDGEAWDNFDYAGITEKGDWMITGDTNGASATDEFIVVNGAFAHREGDTIDGVTVSGSIEGAYMNEDGDYAYIWDIDGGSLEALFFGDQLLLAEGDPVDWDGDGSIDMDTAIDAFTGISSLSMTDRDELGNVVILCTVDVNVPDPAGGSTTVTLEGFLAYVVSLDPPVCDAGGPYMGVVGQPVEFDGTGSSDPNGEIVAYDWDFGDGGTDTGPTPSHTYDMPGEYAVTLTVTDDDGLTSTCTALATIDEPTPILLAGMDVVTEDGVVILDWRLGRASETLGFNVHREELGGPRVQVNDRLVQNLEGRPFSYRFEDHDATPGRTYDYWLENVDADGSTALHGPFRAEVDYAVPGALALHTARPNPFNPTTTIGFDLPAATEVTLMVFSADGGVVRLLVDGEMPAGRHAVQWDGRDDGGRALASGVYLYRLRTGDEILTRKMVLAR